MSPPDVVGVWSWSYDGGNFEVEIRAGGTFHCEAYPEHSHWEQRGETVTIDWGQFGNYTMTASGDGKELSGCYTGYPDDWRKAQKTREHTAEERAQHEEEAHTHSHSHSRSPAHDGCCGAPAAGAGCCDAPAAAGGCCDAPKAAAPAKKGG